MIGIRQTQGSHPLRYRLALFDFDGTLADSFGWFTRTMNGVADRYRFRRVADGEIELLRGMHARSIMAHVGMAGWKMPLVARHVRGRMQAELDQISLFDGVVGALEGLSAAGVTLAVVTSNSEANVRRMLGPRLAKRISHYACGVSIFGKRPRMLQAVRSAGVECAEAIAIGDEVRDAEAAHAAGIRLVR
jgi:phosphoglycolate phosphatase